VNATFCTQLQAPSSSGGSLPEDRLPAELTGRLLAPKNADAGWRSVNVARRDSFAVTLELPLANLTV